MQQILRMLWLLIFISTGHAQLAGTLFIDLSVDKQVEVLNADDFFIGQQALYTLIVSNLEQNSDAQQVLVEDLLPPQVIFVSDDCQGNISGQQWTWELANSLPANSSVSCQLVVEINELGVIENTAEVLNNQSGTDDPELDNNTSTVVFNASEPPILEADLEISQSISADKLVVNETASISIQVNNLGTETVTQSLVTADLPSSITVTETDCAANIDGTTFNWLIDTQLSANESTTCTLTVDLNVAGDFSYVATVDSQDTGVNEINLTNNSSTLDFTVINGVGPQPAAQPVPTLSNIMVVFLTSLILLFSACMFSAKRAKNNLFLQQ